MPKMETNTPTDSFAEELLRSVRLTIPSASLGFPSAEELQRLRQRRHERLKREHDCKSRRLKEAVLACLRKTNHEDDRQL